MARYSDRFPFFVPGGSQRVLYALGPPETGTKLEKFIVLETGKKGAKKEIL
jgi:hypothetical protein